MHHQKLWLMCGQQLLTFNKYLSSSGLYGHPLPVHHLPGLWDNVPRVHHAAIHAQQPTAGNSHQHWCVSLKKKKTSKSMLCCHTAFESTSVFVSWGCFCFFSLARKRRQEFMKWKLVTFVDLFIWNFLFLFSLLCFYSLCFLCLVISFLSGCLFCPHCLSGSVGWGSAV